jgi:hypothetical protein
MIVDEDTTQCHPLVLAVEMCLFLGTVCPVDRIA